MGESSACGGSGATGASSSVAEAGADAAVVEGGLAESGNPDASDSGLPCGWTLSADGLSGAIIVDVMFDERAQPGTVYATAGNSIYLSADSGHTWQTRGTFAGGTIGFLAAPNPSQAPDASSMGDTAGENNGAEALLASSSAGVIRSTDAGLTWSVISFDGQATSSIAVAPSQPLRAYVGIRGSGVFRSDDGGVTWSAVNQGYPYADTLVLDVAPDNPDEVVAGGPTLNAQNGYSNDGFVARTTDGGQSWQSVVTGDGNVWNIRRCASDTTVLYAATFSGVARSADRGATWTVLPIPGGAAGAEDVAINPTNCNDIYAMAQNIGPFHSTDGGQTFGPVLMTGLDLAPPGTWPGRMAVDPQNAGGVVLGSHGGICFSTDGATWNLAQGLLGMVVDALSVSPLDSSQLWLSSWGSGVWQRPSSGQPWQRVPAQQLPVDFAFTVAADPYTGKRIMVGAENPYLSSDGVTFTAGAPTENETAFAFDPTNASVVYATTELQGVYKSTDGGTTWSPSNGGLTPWVEALGSPVIDVQSIVVDPAFPQTLYIGTNGGGVYKSSDGAQSWTSVLGSTQVIQCLLAAPGAQTAIYACVQGSGVQLSIDGGATWTAAGDGLPTLDVTGLARDAVTGDLYATAGSDAYVKQGAQVWTVVDPACMAGAGAGTPAVVTDGVARSLVVSAAGGLYAHPL